MVLLLGSPSCTRTFLCKNAEYNSAIPEFRSEGRSLQPLFEKLHCEGVTRRRVMASPCKVAYNLGVVAKLTTDLKDDFSRPYFLWDEERTVGEFRESLQNASPQEWARAVGKLMREARDPDVWKFVSPKQVWNNFSSLKPYLGRRAGFWEYLLNSWYDDGYLI
jgi:hypothetical protein